ncbi:Ig-like domain repeat protein [Streptacidiphilus sp. PAMC 29251]
MSTNHLPKRIALGTATFLASGAMVLSGISAAYADGSPVGTLSFTPDTGFDNSTMSIVSSGPCVTGSNLVASVSGQGFPAGGYNVVGNSPTTTYSQNAAGGYIVPLFDTMQTFAKNNSIAALSGKYTFTLTCRNAFGAATFDTFTSSIWFTDPTHYVSQDPSGPSVTATTTTLAVTPSGSAASGASVTLTAAVSPSAPGTVQFLDGTTPLGSPVPVTAGAASLSTPALTVGAHQLSAVFTSSSTSFSGSTSAATPYTVSPAGAVATSTALAITPSGSAAAGSGVTLTSTTNPSAAAGSVTFTDAGTGAVLGTQAVSGGSASITVSTLAEGDHNLTASFTPTDSTAYQASVSTAVPFTVTAAGGGTPGGPTPGSENINTTVAPGALALSVAGSNVNLPPLTLNTTSTLYSAAGPIQTVTVTDTRAGAPGWALSGQVADFTSPAGTISAQNLGWAPNLVNKGDGLKVNLGGTVAPAPGVASGDSGALGLKSSRTLATATGLGTAQIGADLSLVAPTSTAAGAYTGVLTLTVM